ncbi:50S ribosomal protein L35 [Candidatus Berkelbacteria bacterium]|nr:50S ribosomal protein L35 [Candidatus Berkelbacteria bacterium]
MPKMKTNKSASKRIVRITRTGKLMRLKMSAQHRRKGKSKAAKRNARKQLVITKGDSIKIKRLLPYGVA